MPSVNSSTALTALPLAIVSSTQGHGVKDSRSFVVAAPPPVLSTPSIGNWTPDPAVQIAATTVVGFDVTDTHGLRRVVVYAATAAGGGELVYDGAAFVAPYMVGSSTTAIANGLRFSIARDDGWTVAPRLTVVAVNVDGIEATSAPPVVGNWSPGGGTQVTAMTPIGFDVTDAAGLGEVIVYATGPTGALETVYDGVAFTADYDAGSVRTDIPGGFRFSVRRDAGWTVPPQITVAAVNVNGIEA